MILLAAAVLVGGLIQEPELTVLSIPPGSSRPFAEAVSAIVDDLKTEQYEEAAKKAAVLPDRSIRVQWDDSKVDASHRSLLIKGREKALDAWERVNQKLEITYVDEDPDILIGFVEKLHKDPETGDQIGAVHFTSYSPLEPRIESIIGLKRGPKLLSIDSIDIANEFAYALGRYFGLERRPRPGSSMFRQETDYRVPPIIGRDEIMTFVACLELTDQLREAAARKNRHFQLGQPRAFVDIKSLDGGTVNQGESMPMSFVVTNSGDAPHVAHGQGRYQDHGFPWSCRQGALPLHQRPEWRGQADTRDRQRAARLQNPQI
jgi:hypothetical protein